MKNLTETYNEMFNDDIDENPLDDTQTFTKQDLKDAFYAGQTDIDTGIGTMTPNFNDWFGETFGETQQQINIQPLDTDMGEDNEIIYAQDAYDEDDRNPVGSQRGPKDGSGPGGVNKTFVR